MRCSTEEERGIRKRETLIITTRPSPRVAQLHSLGLARRRKSNRREETIEMDPRRRRRKGGIYIHGLFYRVYRERKIIIITLFFLSSFLGFSFFFKIESNVMETVRGQS